MRSIFLLGLQSRYLLLVFANNCCRQSTETMQQPPEVCIAGGQRVTRHAILREQMEKEKLIRRSTRDPTVSSLDRHDLTVLLTKIRKNHPSTVILKIKDHIHADINSVVFEAILEALAKNRVCQV